MLSKKKDGFLKPLDDSLTSGSYEGFILKKHFLYGKDQRGHPIATSGFIKDGNLIIYEKKDSGWNQREISLKEARKLLDEESLSEIFRKQAGNEELL